MWNTAIRISGKCTMNCLTERLKGITQSRQGKIGRLEIITKRSALESRKNHSMRLSCRSGIRMIWEQKQPKGRSRQGYWMNI